MLGQHDNFSKLPESLAKTIDQPDAFKAAKNENKMLVAFSKILILEFISKNP